MNANDIWYGFLQAGAKSSPVVRDPSLEAKSPDTVYLYNHVRGMFLEYSLQIVESKLRELQPGDISVKELDAAFRAARKSFSPVRVVKKWSDTTPAAAPEEQDEPDMPPDLDTSIDDLIEDDN